MPDRKKIIERLEQLHKLFIEKNIKQFADDVRDTIDLLKEQEIIEGMVEKTRGEWSDETLPVSCNKEREYSCDHSRRNKA